MRWCMGVEGVGTGGDRLGDELLHAHQCIGGLVGPAPGSIRRCAGDSSQLAQLVGTSASETTRLERGVEALGRG
jgi:hypothetical protein